MSATPLMIGPVERASLHELRKRANRHPVDMTTLTARLTTPHGKATHRAQMTAQSVTLPAAYLVTFSIETGHPGGCARHMSVSVDRHERVPNPEAVWMVAEALGFIGGLDRCVSWPEQLEGHGPAINVVQLIRIEPDISGHA